MHIIAIVLFLKETVSTAHCGHLVKQHGRTWGGLTYPNSFGYVVVIFGYNDGGWRDVGLPGFSKPGRNSPKAQISGGLGLTGVGGKGGYGWRRATLYARRGSRGQPLCADAHVAHVARGEINKSILSFPLYSFEAKNPVCRSTKPLSTPFPEDNQTNLNASHLYTHNIWIGTISTGEGVAKSAEPSHLTNDMFCILTPPESCSVCRR